MARPATTCAFHHSIPLASQVVVQRYGPSPRHAPPLACVIWAAGPLQEHDGDDDDGDDDGDGDDDDGDDDDGDDDDDVEEKE